MNVSSDRLVMGQFERGDLDEWHLIESDPLVRKYIDGSVPTRKQTIGYIDMNINSYARFNFGRYTVRDKKSQKLIGMCGFLTTEMGVDFGYRLSKDTWGYGLGFEAASTVLCYGLEVLGLTDLVAGAMPENLASIKILESLGFIYQADINLDGLNYRKYAFS
jgi:RimJ/RimL family protein N-acetyltransferase